MSRFAKFLTTIAGAIAELDAEPVRAPSTEPGTPEFADYLATSGTLLSADAGRHERALAERAAAEEAASMAAATAVAPAVVDAPAPVRGRVILPLSATKLARRGGKPVQVTARVQEAFTAGRMFVSNSDTNGGASDWLIHDIKIGGRSQFAQAGIVPGDVFASDAVGCDLSFDRAQVGMDVTVTVSYVGKNKKGAIFHGSLIGEDAK